MKTFKFLLTLVLLGTPAWARDFVFDADTGKPLAAGFIPGDIDPSQWPAGNPVKVSVPDERFAQGVELKYLHYVSSANAVESIDCKLIVEDKKQAKLADLTDRLAQARRRKFDLEANADFETDPEVLLSISQSTATLKKQMDIIEAERDDLLKGKKKSK